MSVPDGGFLWGGSRVERDQVLFSSEGATFSPSLGWRRLPPSPLAARVGPLGAWTGSVVLVWGGWTSLDAHHETPDGALYRPAQDSWMSIPPIPLGPIITEWSAWAGNKLIVVADRGPSGWGGFISARPDQWDELDVAQKERAVSLSYDVTLGEWSVLPPVPARLAETLSCWIDDRFICIRSDGSAFIWSPELGRIVETQDLPGGKKALRGLIGFSAVGGRAVLLSCVPQKATGQEREEVAGWAWDPATEGWIALPAPPLSARSGVSVATIENSLCLWGGISPHGGKQVFHRDGAMLHFGH